MKFLKNFENYLTKKKQIKKDYDEHLYDFGFGDIYYVCSNCDSNKLIPTQTGGFSPPEWHCKECGYANGSPKSMPPEDYKEYLKNKEIKKNTKRYNI